MSTIRLNPRGERVCAKLVTRLRREALWGQTSDDRRRFHELADKLEADAAHGVLHRQFYDTANLLLTQLNTPRARPEPPKSANAHQREARSAPWTKPHAGEERRFRGFTVEEFLGRPRPQWIVEGVLPQAELSFIVGEWGSGKSFFALDMAAAVARGVPWRGRETRRVRVVYVVAEGAGGFLTRLDAYCKYHDVARKDLDIIVIPATPNLLQKKDLDELVLEIRRHQPVGWVIVDTLAQVTAGGNENSGEDMGKLVANCKALGAATNAMVTLVHHAGKDVGKGARGWSGLIGAADTEITVSGKDGVRTATITKQKEGEANILLPFRLVTVLDVAVDAKGKPTTSCAVEHEAAARPAAAREPGGDNQKILWRAILELTKPNSPPTVAEVLAEAVARIPHDPQAKDRRRNRMRTALNSLIAGGWVRQENGLVIACRVNKAST